MNGGLLGGLPGLRPSGFAFGRRQLPYPLEQEDVSLFAWGREGLHAGLRATGLGSGDEVLVPAYHHGSEIEAAVRAGLTCRFYLGTPSLEPDEEELEQLLTPRVRALHLTHFLGFPQDCERWRAWCDERGLLLIEDAAQAWLASSGGRPVGSFGDISMFCLYKTIAVAEGSALVSRSPPAPAAGSPIGIGGAVRRGGLWLAQRSATLGTLAQRRPVRSEFDPVAEIALSEPSAPSRLTTALLPRFDYRRARALRRDNYLRLLAVLGGQVPVPFNVLPDGANPWLFPVDANDKAGLLKHLEERGVRAVDFWSVPHPLLYQLGVHSSALGERRACTVGLPVHQELSRLDVDRIATATAGWFG
ncbi:MAG: aminotransferase class V-fold PLP-dependent enzyme [Actinomycetota bacterium]|nr:aminotransferase class V-fold PLP-dependent enzyme [Actinomycetota bacterium]